MHAKTTAGTEAFTLASVLFRNNDFVLIVSDTESQAAMFLGNIKDELLNNDAIKELFGLALNQKGEVHLIKDTETDVIGMFQDGAKFRIIAKGAEQKLRGMNWHKKRPNLIIVDDLENDELVMNIDRRQKLSRWFRAALIPSLSQTGKIRMWGTVLHQDSFLENQMPKDWDRFTVFDGLKTYSTKPRRLWDAIKYRAHDDEMKEFLWPEKFPKEYFLALKQDAADNGMLDVYSQEQLNIPIDESTALFKKRDLLAMNEEDRHKNMTHYITVDLAITERERADYSVFLVAGVDDQRTVHVKNVIRDRIDGKDIVETLFQLHGIYDPIAIGIEDTQITKAIGPFLREEMVARGIYPNIVNLKHGGKDKIQRSRSIQARVRARTVKFDKGSEWFPTFESELLKFPRDRHDDQVDTFAYLGLMLDKIVEAPTQEEIDEEEYLDELRESEYGQSGRSSWTGY